MSGTNKQVAQIPRTEFVPHAPRQIFESVSHFSQKSSVSVPNVEPWFVLYVLPIFELELGKSEREEPGKIHGAIELEVLANKTLK